MVISRVKPKVPVAIFLAILAIVTAFLSGIGWLPSRLIESIYARRVFPTISHIAGSLADFVPFSWLDVWILVLLGVAVYSIRRRKWRLPVGLIALAYLIFFWGWGLNYHRVPLAARLGFQEVPSPSSEQRNQFVQETAESLNRLWPQLGMENPAGLTEADIASAADGRVRLVLSRIDGGDWSAAKRIKHSVFADWWFRVAGIDGLFNPFAQEPILVSGILDFELPFLTAHELAHVHGIADEGDANFVAFLATVESPDVWFRYSGAFEMWVHLGGPVELLDPGPRRDLQAYYTRIRLQEIPRVARLQSRILDSHLKANGVENGIASYSQFVALAIATQDRWKEFQ